jgi:type IV pilus assembly protein PilV
MRLQHGFSLLEVLITLLIIKVGLLGVLAAQTLALRQVQDAVQRTQAVAVSAGVFSELQANHGLTDIIAPQLTLRSVIPVAPKCTALTNCNMTQLATVQLHTLLDQLRPSTGISLTEPLLCLQQDAGAVQLQLSWQQRAATTRAAATCNTVAGRSAFTVKGGGWY